jgi:hypothetical protein
MRSMSLQNYVENDLTGFDYTTERHYKSASNHRSSHCFSMVELNNLFQTFYNLTFAAKWTKKQPCIRTTTRFMAAFICHKVVGEFSFFSPALKFF